MFGCSSPDRSTREDDDYSESTGKREYTTPHLTVYGDLSDNPVKRMLFDAADKLEEDDEG